MKSQVLEGLDQLQALKTDWNRLEAGTLLPMQQFIWIEAAATVFSSRNKLRIVVIKEGEEVRAIAPLVQPHGSPSLEMLGVCELYEPTNAVWSDGAALQQLATALAELRVPLFLQRIPADSPLLDALDQSFRGRGIVVRRPDGPWPWITLDESWKEPERKFNSKRRAYLRRARRMAEELGEVNMEATSPTPETFSSLFEEALRVEAAGWKGKQGTALTMDALRGEFYRRYAAAACERGILRLRFLRLDGRPVAMQLAVETGGRLWLLKIGYDERFAPCSPGNLLITETIRYAAGRGLKSVAFLGAMEPWKLQWTHEQNPCALVRGYPWGVRTGAMLAHDIARFAWQKLVPPKQGALV